MTCIVLDGKGRRIDGTPADNVAEDGLVHLKVRTRHPQDYVLLNERDGTLWRGTAEGRWVRDTNGVAPSPEAQRIHELEEAIDRVLLDVDDDGKAEAHDVAVLALRNVRAGRPKFHGIDGVRVRDPDEPLPPDALVDAGTERLHPPEKLKPSTRGVGGKDA